MWRDFNLDVVLLVQCCYTLDRKVENCSGELEHPTVTSLFSLPTVNIEHLPLTVDLNLPAYGNLKTMLPVRYSLHNRTGYPQELEVSMEASDSFMFSGNKQVCFSMRISLFRWYTGITFIYINSYFKSQFSFQYYQFKSVFHSICC